MNWEYGNFKYISKCVYFEFVKILIFLLKSEQKIVPFFSISVIGET